MIEYKKERRSMLETFYPPHKHDKYKSFLTNQKPDKTHSPVMVDKLVEFPEHLLQYKAKVDENYCHNPEILRDINIAVRLNKPMMLWGHYGTGKTTMVEQFCARTELPFMRVQHTISMQESDVLGQMVVKLDKDGKQYTDFEPGVLAFAMRHGLVYLADEYDFALPAVTSLYQPILEGKPLIIKEAPLSSEWRIVEPHPDFRFFATGNTNGNGDESALYSGTQVMNAANYSRFQITIQVGYLPPEEEIVIVQNQSFAPLKVVERFVQLANEIRTEFKKGGISVTISPRELINAAQYGLALGTDIDGSYWRKGLEVAYMARLPTTDYTVINGLAQRIFGS